MKKIRLVGAMLIAAIISVGVAASSGAASDEIYNTAMYPDVPVDASYFDAVSVLSYMDVISGFEDGTFRPDELVTRAQITKMIIDALGEGEEAYKLTAQTKFWDVSSDHWANGYINKAVNDTFISGYNDYEFGPDDNVTYLQAQKMLVSAIGYETFAQGSGGWPNGYKTWAASQGITYGMSGLADDTQLTRADVAKLVYNAMDAPVCIVKDYDTTFDGRLVPNLEVKDDEGEDFQNLFTKRHDVYKVKGYLKNNNTFVVTQADNFDNEYYPNGSNKEVNIPTNYGWNGGSQVVNNKYYGSEYLNIPCTAYLSKGKLTGWGIMYLTTGNSSNFIAGLRPSENKVYYKKNLEYADADDNTNIVSTNDKKTYYEFQNPDETIKNAKTGDIVVIKPCDAVPSGLSVKVKRIEKNGKSIRIYKDDLKAEEIVDDIDIAQSVPIELQSVDTAKGIQVEELTDSDI
ncbi:MAG: S-layer homology domain-containing protein, partial [Clostridia bacterium]|nr:S-layer homology domain-containing protein [Clostridia bacterium]